MVSGEAKCEVPGLQTYLKTFFFSFCIAVSICNLLMSRALGMGTSCYLYQIQLEQFSGIEWLVKALCCPKLVQFFITSLIFILFL